MSIVWYFHDLEVAFLFTHPWIMVQGSWPLPTIWDIAFSYFQLSNSFSFSPTGFSAQNLAGAILSLCKMECLQHLSSLGKLSKSIWRKIEKKRWKNYYFCRISTQTKAQVLCTLCRNTVCRHTVKIPLWLKHTEHNVNVINTQNNPPSYYVSVMLSV